MLYAFCFLTIPLPPPHGRTPAPTFALCLSVPTHTPTGTASHSAAPTGTADPTATPLPTLSPNTFVKPDPSTCDDGLHNGDEGGVDCGGSCPDCATCRDGVRNGDETGPDCGGSCPGCVVYSPDKVTFENNISMFGATLGQEQRTANFTTTKVFGYGGLGVGFWAKEDPQPLPSVPGGTGTVEVKLEGPGVQKMKVVFPFARGGGVLCPKRPPVSRTLRVCGTDISVTQQMAGIGAAHTLCQAIA